jgi:hypothetical protein
MKKEKASRVLVAHACNPSYSGSRDQEDFSSKPAQANSSQKWVGGVAQGVGSEVKPHNAKKKKRKRKTDMISTPNQPSH